MEKVKSQRIYQYDVIRIIAAVAVVAIHSFTSLTLFAPLGSKTWWLGNVIVSGLRWAVPVFIMMSGALIVRPQALQPEKLAHFYKSKVGRTLVPLLVFSAVYAIWYAKFESPLPLYTDLSYAAKQFLLGSPLPGHLYFLFIIFGLYVLSPFINHAVSALSVRRVAYAAVAILGYSAIELVIATWLNGATRSNIMFDSALPYAGYFLLGYVLHEKREQLLRMPMRRAVALLTGAWAIVATGTFGLSVLSGGHSATFFYEYLNPVVAALSVGLFIVAYKVATTALATYANPSRLRAISVLSNATFGVYLVHIFFIEVCGRYLPPASPLMNASRVFFLVAIVSFATVTIYQIYITKFHILPGIIKRYMYRQRQGAMPELVESEASL